MQTECVNKCSNVTITDSLAISNGNRIPERSDHQLRNALTIELHRLKCPHKVNVTTSIL